MSTNSINSAQQKLDLTSADMNTSDVSKAPSSPAPAQNNNSTTASVQVTISSAARLAASQNATSSSYDFTNMTPKQMQGAAQDLFNAGKIDLTQLFMLQTAGVPMGKQGANGEFVALSPAEQYAFENKHLDYVQISKDAIGFLQNSGYAFDPLSGYEQWKGILAAL